jgi:SAM-dependent methyltransferase
LTRALAFLSAPRPLDLAARLARLRWRRAASADALVEFPAGAPAASVLPASESWVLVAEEAAIPLGPVPEPPAGGVAVGFTASLAPGCFAHTLRELAGRPVAAQGCEPVAVALRTADFPALGDETMEVIFRQLLADAPSAGASFPVLILADPSDRERPEITRHLPAGPLRILDAGCGAGGLALARTRNPSWEVVGIERDAVLAARARERCSSLLEGDLIEILDRLASAGERFDAVVLADVLEHLEEPIEALSRARRLVPEGGRLVVSVPNVGHLSVVRDLLLGRFDPVPSGLCDAGHLRWFTRESLREALEEAGWRVETLEGEAGAPAPEAEAFTRLADAWPDADRESLATYQWIATARAR